MCWVGQAPDGACAGHVGQQVNALVSSLGGERRDGSCQVDRPLGVCGGPVVEAGQGEEVRDQGLETPLVDQSVVDRSQQGGQTRRVSDSDLKGGPRRRKGAPQLV